MHHGGAWWAAPVGHTLQRPRAALLRVRRPKGLHGKRQLETKSGNAPTHPQGHFSGTLFRLPLRTPEAAAASDIKRTATTADDALALLGALARELPQALLFLKSVT